jgi:hypothetical protein
MQFPEGVYTTRPYLAPSGPGQPREEQRIHSDILQDAVTRHPPCHFQVCDHTFRNE